MKTSGDRYPGALLVTLLALAAGGCGSQQSVLDPQSPNARGIATIWWVMLAGSVIGLGVIVGLLVASWFRRRRRGRDRPGTIVVLVLGIATPILVLAALFFYSNIFLLDATSPPPANAATHALEIRVTGHQFWWEVRYPGTGAVTANEIHIPVRTRVIVYVHTDDVIHSFWVPQLNRKIDMLPEQVNRVALYAERPGRFRGQCAEFCGLQHAHMGLYVFAEPRAQFARWLRHEAQPATRTSSLFDDKCSSCHAVRGTAATSRVGPDLTHVGSRTSLAALTIPNTPVRMREWLARTQLVKPGAQMPEVDLTRAQVDELTRYLESLK